MKDLRKIIDAVTGGKNIGIISHMNPDGDAVSSQIALALGLKQLGIKTVLINKDPAPAAFKFLSGFQEIKPIEEIEKIPDIIVFVDCATQERTGYDFEEIDLKDKITINIDHHISNTNFCKYNLVKPKAAATAEIVYDFLSLLQIKIDKEIATALYTGISTDTGSFMYENTTPTTHRIAADLINYGADTNLVRINFYENTSRQKIELLKIGLNNLEISQDGQIAWITYDVETFEKLGLKSSDSDGVISYVKGISDVEVAFVFKEVEKNKFKISMRAKSWFDVNDFAKIFGGGGHIKAAGCTIEGSKEEVVNRVIEACKERIIKGRA